MLERAAGLDTYVEPADRIGDVDPGPGFDGGAEEVVEDCGGGDAEVAAGFCSLALPLLGGDGIQVCC